MRLATTLLSFGIALFAISARADAPPAGTTILFVCLHGSVKSQMAAAHFNRIARERGLPYTAISRGIEVDSAIPPRIRAELNREGLAPLDDVPQQLTASEAAGAVKVVAFDMVPEKNRGATEVNYWSDVPATSKNYPALRDAIVHHIDDLVPVLMERPRPRVTMQGTVMAISERKDSITLRLADNSSSDFKVQDGLLFDVVRYGDQVKVAVENVGGTKTIVGLSEQ